MSDKTETEIAKATSTTTSGKYLNPEMYEGLIEEIYSQRTPLDLLLETCNKIGNDSDWNKTGAKEIRQRSQNKEQEKKFLQNRRSNNRRCEMRDDHDDVIALDWFQGRKSARRVSAEDECAEAEAPDVDPCEQDQPQDLRCWFRERSSAVHPCAGSLAAANKASSGDTHLSSSSSSSPDEDRNQFSPKSVEERKISRDSGDRIQLRSGFCSRENLKYADEMTTRQFLPTYYDTEVLLRQYLELQSLAQTAVIQEYFKNLHHLTLNKASTVLSSGNVASGGVGSGLKLMHVLPEVLANQAVLSQLQLEGALLGQMVVGGLTPPLGVPLFGRGTECYGQLQLPLFDQRVLLEKGKQFHPSLIQMRPDVEMGHRRVLEKRLDRQRQFAETTNESFYLTSPDTSSDRDTPPLRSSPKSPKTAPNENSSRKDNSSLTSKSDEDLRKYHPYKRSISSSDETCSRSLKSFDRFSRSYEPRILSKTSY